VLAIIITIMVLETEGPARRQLAEHRRLWPVFLSYVPELHVRRHLLEQPPPPDARRHARHRRHAVGEPAPAVLALAVPFATGWMGENHFAPLPSACTAACC
jgi:hypothetical protein